MVGLSMVTAFSLKPKDVKSMDYSEMEDKIESVADDINKEDKKKIIVTATGSDIKEAQQKLLSEIKSWASSIMIVSNFSKATSSVVNRKSNGSL